MNQPLAYVHPQARVANNVVIEPFVTIEKNVEVDEGTWIGHHVTIMEGAKIGKNCRIFPGAVIAAIPQDLSLPVKKPVYILATILLSVNLSPLTGGLKPAIRLLSAITVS